MPTPSASATPRPWTQYGSMIYAAGTLGANICEVSEPRATAYVEHTRPDVGGAGWSEAMANAALIVHAANSFDALVEALEAILTHGERCNWFADRGDEEVREQAHRALALARGEQQTEEKSSAAR